MNKIKILALFGKSGAGKDTILNWMVSYLPNTKRLIFYTTRLKRDYEKDDKDYHFIDMNTFMSKINDKTLIADSMFNGWYYGLPIEELDEDKVNIGIFNIETIYELNADSRLEVLPVMISAPDKLRLERNFNREENPNYKEICRRFVADEEDFKDIQFDYVTFLNDTDLNLNHNYYCNIHNIPAIKEFLKDKNN